MVPLYSVSLFRNKCASQIRLECVWNWSGHCSSTLGIILSSSQMNHRRSPMHIIESCVCSSIFLFVESPKPKTMANRNRNDIAEIDEFNKDGSKREQKTQPQYIRMTTKCAESIFSLVLSFSALFNKFILHLLFTIHGYYNLITFSYE